MYPISILYQSPYYNTSRIPLQAKEGFIGKENSVSVPDTIISMIFASQQPNAFRNGISELQIIEDSECDRSLENNWIGMVGKVQKDSKVAFRIFVAKCRSEVLRNFTDVGNDCDDICKPSCRSVRYDISLSKANWPNMNHQQFVMNRSFDQWSHLPEALGLLDALEYDENTTDFVNDTFFSENLLRVHVFVEEMIYMSIEENYSYTLPKLMADLGGCLGLYLGVSVISIIEFIDLFGSATLLCLMGNRDFDSSMRRTGSRKRRRRNRTTENGTRPSIGFFKRRAQSNKNHFRNVDQAWKNSAFSSRDIYYQNDSAARKQALRWS
ncbi:uncharacterized protein NPIL_351801 [Nephila pilipes]|uniref:Uncharacterized protein n=1 Tax=Nephila pilipes TaxID=299642 RepID=A0A8X6QTF6_NEPPI|nr:uncharacterized protein NPIL_351801 [Nephila pilipes]